jgi:ABC-type phosphate transport system permease subunit
MFEVILGIGMVVIGFFAFFAVGCVILKVMFKIADKIFGF